MMTLNFNRELSPVQLTPVVKPINVSSLFDQRKEKVLKKGEMIFNESSSHFNVYLVTKGMVKLNSYQNGKKMLVDYYQKGEMFNCENLLNADRGEFSAEAMTQLTSIKKVPVHIFQQAMKSNTLLYAEILESISSSLQRNQARLQRMTLLSSNQRVIHFLANHVMKAGRRVGYEWVVKPIMTHQDMGDITGTSRQTVTTVLNELRREGLIHFNRSYLIIRDMSELLKRSNKA